FVLVVANHDGPLLVQGEVQILPNIVEKLLPSSIAAAAHLSENLLHTGPASLQGLEFLVPLLYLKIQLPDLVIAGCEGSGMRTGPGTKIHGLAQDFRGRNDTMALALR